MNESGKQVWRRLVWALVLVLAIVLLQSVYRPSLGWIPGTIITALVLFAAVKPYEALCVLAGIGPLAALLFFAAGTGRDAFHYHEAFALAIIGGWAARRMLLPRRLAVPPALRWCTLTLLAVVIASAVVNGAIVAAENPSDAPSEVVRSLVFGDYLETINALKAALLLAEGLVILLVACDLCAGDGRKRETVLRMIVAGAAAGVVMNLLRLALAAVPHPQPLQTFAGYVLTQRVNVLYADLNAGGSFFAMAVFFATGLALRSRALTALLVGLLATGVWLTGSRTALISVVAVTLGAGVIRLARRQTVAGRLRVAGALALVALVAAVVWWNYPQRAYTASAKWSFSTRVDLAKAAVAMAREEPLFGVGAGRYYDLSTRYAGAMLAEQQKVRENAHNYYLQVLAELGIPGLALFIGVLCLALREAWRGPRSAVSLALVAGLCAFLITCLAGHPMLVAGAAFPFWIALGLAASPATAAVAPTARWLRFATVAAVVLIAVSVPLRASTAGRLADMERVSAGFSRWQIQPDGSRYRFAGGRAMFYVSASALSVRIPMRHGGATDKPVEVVVYLDGREVNRVLLPHGDEWRAIRVVLRDEGEPYTRIDLESRVEGEEHPMHVEPTGSVGAIAVGKPIVYY